MPQPGWLAAVSTEEIAVRVLHNLKRAHLRVGDLPGGMLASDRLFELTAGAEHQRDRGLIALRLGATGAATEDLRAYLTKHPAAPDAKSVRAALSRAESATNRYS